MEGITPEQLEAIQQQCIFCQIASGKVAAKKVYEDDQIIAILDINPANPGHILLITKKHYFVMPQMPDDETGHVGIIAKQLSHVLLKALKIEGTNIFVANGVTAGQRAQHFMLHIIPRMDKDKVGLEIPQREISKEDFEKIYSAMKKGVDKILGKTNGPKKETEEIIEEAEEPTAGNEETEEQENKEEIEEEHTEEKKTKSKTVKTKKAKKEKTSSKKSKEKPAKKSPSSLDDIARLLGV